MLEVDEYIINLLVAFVHLRIFAFELQDDCPIKDGHTFIMKAFDRVPHLEYISMSHLDLYYKRAGRELVVCESTCAVSRLTAPFAE
jgi:hypothetical protein